MVKEKDNCSCKRYKASLNLIQKGVHEEVLKYDFIQHFTEVQSSI